MCKWCAELKNECERAETKRSFSSRLAPLVPPWLWHFEFSSTRVPVSNTTDAGQPPEWKADFSSAKTYRLVDSEYTRTHNTHTHRRKRHDTEVLIRMEPARPALTCDSSLGPCVSVKCGFTLFGSHKADDGCPMPVPHECTSSISVSTSMPGLLPLVRLTACMPSTASIFIDICIL